MKGYGRMMDGPEAEVTVVTKKKGEKTGLGRMMDEGPDGDDEGSESSGASLMKRMFQLAGEKDYEGAYRAWCDLKKEGDEGEGGEG